MKMTEWCEHEGTEWCEHEDHDLDIFTGRAQCGMCGHIWYQTKEDMEAEERCAREYDEWQRRENRREWWLNVTRPIRWPIFRFLEKIWPRKSCSALHNGEIPF